MQQILEQLQSGSPEVVKDNGDGTLVHKITPPSALNMRAARVIVQIAQERDGLSRTAQHYAEQLQLLLDENATLNTKLKEFNDRNTTSPISPTQSSASDQSDSGVDSAGKVEVAGSEAS